MTAAHRSATVWVSIPLRAQPALRAMRGWWWWPVRRLVLRWFLLGFNLDPLSQAKTPPKVDLRNMRVEYTL